MYEPSASASPSTGMKGVHHPAQLGLAFQEFRTNYFVFAQTVVKSESYPSRFCALYKTPSVKNLEFI